MVVLDRGRAFTSLCSVLPRSGVENPLQLQLPETGGHPYEYRTAWLVLRVGRLHTVLRRKAFLESKPFSESSLREQPPHLLSQDFLTPCCVLQ